MRTSFRYTSLHLLMIATLLTVAVACGEKHTAASTGEDSLRNTAHQLALRYGIIDGHVDWPMVLYEKKVQPGKDNDTLLRTGKGEFDYQRARLGGVSAPFMSIYIPAAYQKKPDHGKALADSLINLVNAIAKALPDKFALAGSPGQVTTNFTSGKISLPMGMENGAPLGNDVKNVQYFFDRGIRYITLTHNRDNQLCDSSGDTTHTWNGLSPLGRKVVSEMNRVGIMVDISHVDDSTFYQVMKLTKVPCIASHSSCRYFAPTVRRDMTDDMIRALGENGGVVLVNFYRAFLDSTFVRRLEEDRKKVRAWIAEKKLHFSDSLANRLMEQWEKETPYPRVDTATVANHIDHVRALIGIDHVGIGSDFDGVEGSLPAGLADVSTYPNLIYCLLRRGYSEKDIEKIVGGNFRRVWQKTLEAAGHPL